MDETDETNLLVRLTRRLKLEEKLRAIATAHGFQPAIQGEVIGPGIQKNKYELAEVSLRVFNLFDIGAFRLVDHAHGLQVLREAGLESVPQLGTIDLNHTVDQLVEFSVGPSVLNARAQREGIVLRPLAEEFDPDLAGRLSFKVINPKFLLKYDE
jgi:ATP-dependent RNA circularization protein (DNA/RNA ligase family)